MISGFSIISFVVALEVAISQISFDFSSSGVLSVLMLAPLLLVYIVILIYGWSVRGSIKSCICSSEHSMLV